MLLTLHAAVQEVEYFEKPFAFLSLGDDSHHRRLHSVNVMAD